MPFVMFTKLLKDLSIAQLADTIRELGFDGFDLAVRPGFPVNPDNVATALPNPAKPEVEPLLAACAEVGCRHIKLGYWVWRGEPYWEGVDRVRQALEGFQAICAKYEVCVAVHTHSGPYYGSNASGAMHLVKGFDPRYIGIYLDPGHLAINGEDLPMAFAMTRDHLCLLAVKSPGWFQSKQDGQVKWEWRLLPLREGIVNWRQVLEQCRAVGFTGPISLHSEYEHLSREDLLAVTRDDLAYLKELAAEVGRGPATT